MHMVFVQRSVSIKSNISGHFALDRWTDLWTMKKSQISIRPSNVHTLLKYNAFSCL